MKRVVSIVIISIVSCSIAQAVSRADSASYVDIMRTNTPQGVISKEKQQQIRLNQLKMQLDLAIKNNAANIDEIKRQISALEKDMKKTKNRF